MSTVNVTECMAIGGGMPGSESAQIVNTVGATMQTITVGSTASAAFGGSTTLVELSTDTACHVAFGTAPTSSDASFLLPANEPRQFGVHKGQKVIAF
jgi:hypothetical protein